MTSAILMNRIAFIFTSSPHGSHSGREGLDALLATAALNQQVAVFFIGDGIFQILPAQQPQHIMSRDYIASFGILPVYDVEQIYVCADSLQDRGISEATSWVLPVTLLSYQAISQRLADFDRVFTF